MSSCLTRPRLLSLCLVAWFLIPSCNGGQPLDPPVTPTPTPAPPVTPIPPGVPPNLRISAIGTDFIVWMWDPVVGADGYEVQFRFDDAFTEADEVITTSAHQTTYRAGSVPFATSGYLRARAFAGAGESRLESGWSESVTGMTEDSPGARSWPKFGEFTDSQGRTITYGLHLREEWDPTEPRGLLILFHGNNIGTQQELSNGPWAGPTPFDFGLAVARVASPESHSYGGRPGRPLGGFTGRGGTRFWSDSDVRLVHELLQSGFDSQLAIDYDRIVFRGGSQGTCFANTFVARYAGIYGGGLHAWCGCFWGHSGRPPRKAGGGSWEPTVPLTPFSVAMLRDRFRVFVEATTGDFVHADAVAATNYYRDVLGLDTRADLESPGGHCATGPTPRAEIWEWLSHGADGSPPTLGSDHDADGDGLSNARDTDDDNDGALDFVDSLPLDPRGHLDTDGDGVGNYKDRDADGDGVNNAEDPFASNSGEWLDTDADGIGNNVDGDDDNDGLPDGMDPDPLRGVAAQGLTFHHVVKGVARFHGQRSANVHPRRPARLIYPQPSGDRQSYQYVELGDGPDPRFQIMIDRFERRESCHAVLLPKLCADPWDLFEHYADRIYVDTDQNGNLTDDGPPLVLTRSRNDGSSFLPHVSIVLNVPYASGETLPYGVSLWTTGDLRNGIGYQNGGFWMGPVRLPSGEPILVAALDWNLDGLFNSERHPGNIGLEGEPDLVCLDLNRDGNIEECNQDYYHEHLAPPDSVATGEIFTLDGQDYRVVVAATGHQAEILPAR